MLQVQRSVRGRALAFMSDEHTMLPTGELLDRLRATKVAPHTCPRPHSPRPRPLTSIER